MGYVRTRPNEQARGKNFNVLRLPSLVALSIYEPLALELRLLGVFDLSSAFCSAQRITSGISSLSLKVRPILYPISGFELANSRPRYVVCDSLQA
jgi:hypothetical protein